MIRRLWVKVICWWLDRRIRRSITQIYCENLERLSRGEEMGGELDRLEEIIKCNGFYRKEVMPVSSELDRFLEHI